MSKASELANLIGNINAGGGGVNRNVVINGNMSVAQRATSSTDIGASTGYFTVDRYQISPSGTAGRLTMTQDSSAPSGFANSIKLACTTADTSIAAGELLLFRQSIEGQNLQAFAKGTSDAKPFALSFYVKGNASATYVAELYDEDNNRQVSKSFSVGTDWTRVELSMGADTTGALDDDNASSLTFQIWLHGGSSYTGGTLNTTWGSVTQANRAAGISSFFDSTDRTFFITGVQLEVGQNPTEFEHEPFQVTLSKCQRYYEEPFGSFRAGTNLAGTLAVSHAYTVQKRANPTVTVTSEGSRDAVSSHGIQSNTVNHCAEQFAIGSGVSGSYLYGSQVKADAEL